MSCKLKRISMGRSWKRGVLMFSVGENEDKKNVSDFPMDMNMKHKDVIKSCY